MYSMEHVILTNLNKGCKQPGHIWNVFDKSTDFYYQCVAAEMQKVYNQIVREGL